MKVIPLTNALGAVLEGVDPRDPDLDFDAVYAALLEHEVVFFPQVHLTDDEHMAFGRRFGTPSIFPMAKHRGATEPVLTTITDLPDQPNAADHWHTDVTWIAEPPKVALLTAQTIPERGGDTLWASGTAAYEALSPKFREWLCGMTVMHSVEGFLTGLRKKLGDDVEELVNALRREYPPVAHPLVRTHPETGRRALMYSAQFMTRVVGVSDDESRAVLDFVGTWLKDAAFQVRWHWSPGDLAVWDERSTAHRAAGDHFPQPREIRRLEIDGDRPFFTP